MVEKVQYKVNDVVRMKKKHPCGSDTWTILRVGMDFGLKCNGITTFATNSNSVRLNQPGMYHITAQLVGSGTAAGVVTVQLNENGFAIPSALSSQTITTATTEQRTLVIDYFIIVNSSCVLGNLTTEAKTLTLTNTGVGATFTSVVFNVEKVL